MSKKIILLVVVFAISAFLFGMNVQQTKAKPMCIQVITYAENPSNKACKVFPTPCDVPPNWTIVDSCN